jgi:hypothetical protein
MKYLLLFLLSIPVMVSAQTVTIDPDGTMKVKCPSCPVCPICPPPVIKRDTIYLPVYRDTIIYRDTCTSVPVPNKPPSANAGSDKSITLPTTVTSTQGSGTDPDGTIAGYSWTKISGPTASIGNQFTSTPTFTLSTAGQYIFRLAVTDNKGLSASDDITITLNPGSTTPGQIFNFTPAQIASNVELSPRPGRGTEWWNREYKFPEAGNAADAYVRYKWNDFENGQGQYFFTKFDNDMQNAINNGRKMGFGIMTCFPGNGVGDNTISYDGGTSIYPLYLHQLMQNESVKDWKTNGSDRDTGPTDGNGYWVPNYNSPTYLARLLALNKAIYAHIVAKGWKDHINYIDVRGYGSTGEWHHAYAVSNMNQFPTGTRATDATLKRIIDTHVEGFPDIQLVAMVHAFDCNTFNNTMVSPAVAYHALTVRNQRGLLGWRRDNWGDGATYYDGITSGNRNIVNGMRFDTAIMNRYKYAPIVGEPCCAPGTGYSNLEAHVRKFHINSFGNSNYDGGAVASNVVAASRAAGYRYTISTASVDTRSGLIISVNWSNLGVAPTYEDWKITYTIGSWTGTSTLNLRLFEPGAKPSTDSFSMPAIPAGTYQVKVKIVDPKGIRPPISLAIQGRESDGSYSLGTITKN